MARNAEPFINDGGWVKQFDNANYYQPSVTHLAAPVAAMTYTSANLGLNK